MGGLSIWHWIIVALVILVLFGRGRISEVMGDFGKGISSFRKGLSEADKQPEEKPAPRIAPPSASAVESETASEPEKKDAN